MSCIYLLLSAPVGGFLKKCYGPLERSKQGMEAPKKELKFRGRTLRQLKRTGMIAIYDVRNAGQMLYGYEVIRIKVKPSGEVFVKSYPEREAYPE